MKYSPIILLLALCMTASALRKPHAQNLLETATTANVQPVHWWRFNHANSNSVHDSGDKRGPAATLSNAEYVNDALTGTSVHLKGQLNSFVSFGPTIGQFGQDDFSLTWWMKTSYNQRYFDVLGNRIEGSHGNFVSVRMTAAGVLAVEIDQDYSGTNYVALTSAPGKNDGNWHYYAVTRAGTTVSVYIDGGLVASGNTGGVTNLSNAKPFKLGPSYTWEPQFGIDALFERFSVWNVALSASQVSAAYGNGVPQIYIQ